MQELFWAGLFFSVGKTNYTHFVDTSKKCIHLSTGTSQDASTGNIYPRRFVKKRRGTRRSANNSFYWKRGTISEASESSVEEQYAARDFAGNVIHSDSDDLAARYR